MLKQKRAKIERIAKRQFLVDIVADSLNPKGERLTTFRLVYPRFIHQEVLTHRVFSRNAQSSRAVPTMKFIKQVWNQPALFVEWGANNPGMQSKSLLSDFKAVMSYYIWILSAKLMCITTYLLYKIGCHKQILNRLLEPWQYMYTTLSATELDNFFALRCHSDAQPEIRYLAECMHHEYCNNTYKMNILNYGEWHLPYIHPEEREIYNTYDLIKFSVARCARSSYGADSYIKTDPTADLKLYDRLLAGQIKHSSPAEHQAKAVKIVLPGYKSNYSGGWLQYRKTIPGENITRFHKPKSDT